MHKICVDAMGGDNAPEEIIKGAILSLENKEVQISLVGREDEVRKCLGRYSYDSGRVQVVNADEIITNEDAPAASIRGKKNSSIAIGLNMVKSGECSGFVSAGSTGALLAGATLIVGRVKGILRPALGALAPFKNGFSLILDVGANVDSKPIYLEQFAKLGVAYMETIMDVKNPKVALINIGAEKEKGDSLTKEAYTLLEASNINFVGNIEPRDIPEGNVDILVCDGFVGNVVLKYTEGLSMSLLKMVKEEMMKKTIYKAGALLSKGAFQNLKKKLQYDEIGGAPFLGLKGLVVKAHGSSGAIAIKGAVNQCYLASKNQLVDKISQYIV
jgi:glycerol-3-phosphate acyltransferase PlsX